MIFWIILEIFLLASVDRDMNKEWEVVRKKFLLEEGIWDETICWWKAFETPNFTKVRKGKMRLH